MDGLLRNSKVDGRNGALFGVERPPQRFCGVRKHKHTSKNKKLCSTQTLVKVWSVLSSKTHPDLADWSNPQRLGSRNGISTSFCLKLNKKFVRNKVFCFWKSVCVSWHQGRVVVVVRRRTTLHSAHPLLSSLTAILMCYLYTKLTERTLKKNKKTFQIIICNLDFWNWFGRVSWCRAAPKALLEDKEQFQVLQTGKDRFQNFRVRDLNEFVAS